MHPINPTLFFKVIKKHYDGPSLSYDCSLLTLLVSCGLSFSFLFNLLREVGWDTYFVPCVSPPNNNIHTNDIREKSINAIIVIIIIFLIGP